MNGSSSSSTDFLELEINLVPFKKETFPTLSTKHPHSCRMSSSLSSSLFYNRCGSSGVADHRGREYHVSNFAPFSAAEWKLR